MDSLCLKIKNKNMLKHIWYLKKDQQFYTNNNYKVVILQKKLKTCHKFRQVFILNLIKSIIQLGKDKFNDSFNYYIFISIFLITQWKNSKIIILKNFIKNP